MCLFLANDHELIDEDTEQDGVDDSVEDVDLAQDENLRLSPGVNLDHHEGDARVVPQGRVLVQEEVPIAAVFSLKSDEYAGLK